jgi:hypothetical protein
LWKIRSRDCGGKQEEFMKNTRDRGGQQKEFTEDNMKRLSRITGRECDG